MEVRITATYSATDGRMPESVEVICEGVGVDQARSLMAPVLDMLLMAPTARYLSSADVPRMAEAARAAARSLANANSNHEEIK